MICVIDRILNRITMYRLTLYYTAGLLVVAFLLGLIGLVPQDPTALTFSCALMIGACWLTNRLFAGFLRVPTNTEFVRHHSTHSDADHAAGTSP